ncbi:AsmA family protein [Orrella sp. 11846]|uniref:AsmA family protein n=1 Tax=Orrella sp. 11846 TaxID=3409913 RepID=UPI003B5B2391
MKKLRYLIYGLLAVIALVVIGATVFVYTFDPNQYKGDIERLVKEHTGRTLTIAGDIEMSIYPQLGVQTGALSLSEADDSQTFVSVNSASVSVALMPILKREILVDGVVLDGLNARIVRNKDGQFNFDDLFQKASSVEESDVQDTVKLASKEGDATDVQFDVAAIHISHATLTYDDEQSGEQLSLQDFNLSTDQIAMQAQGDLKLSSRIISIANALDLNVALQAQYKLDLSDKALALSDLDLSIDGKASTLNALKASLKGDLSADLSTQAFTMDAWTITASEKNLFNASVRGNRLQYQADLLQVSEISAQASLDQKDQKLGIDLKIPNITGQPDHLKIPSLTATAKIDMADVLEKAVSVALQGNLDVNLGKSSLQGALKANVDDTNLNATFSMPSLSPAAYQFDVKVDQIDVDRYLAAKPTAKGDASKASGESKASSSQPVAGNAGAPIDVSFLKGLNLQGKVAVGSLKAQGFTATDIKTDIKGEKGVLRVGPHSAQISGGALQGDLSINANNNQFQVKEALNRISVAQLLKDLGQESRLEGQADVNLNVTAQGKDARALIASLSGTGGLKMSEGAIRGVDIARLLRSIQSIITSGKLPTFSPDDKTVFSELSASLNIQKGVVSNQDLLLKAPLFRVQGQGNVNLNNEVIDYEALLAIVETSQGQGGPELEVLRGVTVPVKLTGTLSDPGYRIDIASLAAQIAKSRAGDRIQKEVEKAIGPEAAEKVEKLLTPGVTDKLKGLFGRKDASDDK